MRRFATTAVLYLSVLAIAAVAVSASSGGDTPDTPRALVPSEEIELVAALEPFDGCEALLQYFKDEALRQVGPYGLGGQEIWYGDDVVMEGDMAFSSGGAAAVAGNAGGAAPEVAAERSAVDSDESAARDTAGKAFSGTNVQEAGVDEPDTVKTDGRILVVLARGRLHIFGVNPDGLRRLGGLRVPDEWGHEIMLDGDRVLILGNAMGDVRPLPEPTMDTSSKMIAPVGAPVSTFRMVDISDPTSPELVSTLELDGEYVSARLVDGVARVVVRSQPAALPFVMPRGGGLRAERRAEAENREVVRESTVDQWLPYAVLTDEQSGEETEQTLLDCTAVHHPEQFSGFGLVSVLTVDLSAHLRTDGSAGVVGAAETVYASAENLYVALNQWQDEAAGPRSAGRMMAPDSVATDIHQFDISEPDAARYVASGTVNGRLLNQWAMSEHDGHLRVATTVEDFRGRRPSESAVTILGAEGSTLRRVGRVGGLGKTEQIYSVRFEGDIGYVVTFRQTDPLYTLDLSDPANPRTVGELKINGYSAYLHPVGDGRILGVGQDATKTGRITGSQVSLFDVADLSDPRRLDQLDLGSGSSAVEYDHRAFTFWSETSTAVVPLQTWEGRTFSGVVVLHVGRDGLRREGEITHSGRIVRESAADIGYCCGEGPMISRSLVLGDALITVSDVGVMLSGLHDLQRRDWSAFQAR